MAPFYDCSIIVFFMIFYNASEAPEIIFIYSGRNIDSFIANCSNFDQEYSDSENNLKSSDKEIEKENFDFEVVLRVCKYIKG